MNVFINKSMVLALLAAILTSAVPRLVRADEPQGEEADPVDPPGEEADPVDPPGEEADPVDPPGEEAEADEESGTAPTAGAP